eukprot:COSAG01_NODE_7518_length_3169_cov_5.177524_3_plen_120_part_00
MGAAAEAVARGHAAVAVALDSTLGDVRSAAAWACMGRDGGGWGVVGFRPSPAKTVQPVAAEQEEDFAALHWTVGVLGCAANRCHHLSFHAATLLAAIPPIRRACWSRKCETSGRGQGAR